MKKLLFLLPVLFLVGIWFYNIGMDEGNQAAHASRDAMGVTRCGITQLSENDKEMIQMKIIAVSDLFVPFSNKAGIALEYATNSAISNPDNFPPDFPYRMKAMFLSFQESQKEFMDGYRELTNLFSTRGAI